METSEVLNRAADLIEERGWRAGGGWNGDHGSGLCLEGGIQAAMGVAVGPGYRCPAYHAVAQYLAEQGNTRPLFIWNDRLPYYSEATGEWLPSDQFADARARAPRRVVEMLRACAVIEQSRERQPAEAVAS